MIQLATRLNYQLCRNITKTSLTNAQIVNSYWIINRQKTTDHKKNPYSKNVQQAALKLDPNKKHECPPPPAVKHVKSTPCAQSSVHTVAKHSTSKGSSSGSSGSRGGGSSGSSRNESSGNSCPPPENGFKTIIISAGSVVGLGSLLFAYKKFKTPKIPKESAEEKISKLEIVKKFRAPYKTEDIPKHIPYVLIGGGTASFAAFRAIKSNEPRAKVLVISDEDVMPYMRPPISKEIWFDTKLGLEEARFKQWNGAERSLYYEPEEFYMSVEKLDEAKNGGVSVIRGYTVTKLDVLGQKLTLDDGSELTYDKCLIATGSKPKTLDVFDSASPKVRERIFTYKKIKDFEIVKNEVENAKSIAIVGNGFLGSELACALAHHGQERKLKVYQLFPEKGNMAKVLPSYLSSWTTNRISEVGVEVKPESQIISAEIYNGNQVKLTLNNGTNFIVDFVVQAIGSEPNTELAKSGSLEIDGNLGGLVVNAELEARSNLYAAGDVACFYDPRLGRRRVEHHDHAVVSGRLAGENMVGLKKPYKHQSMFWSDLGTAVGFEAIGLVDSSLPTVAVFAKQTPTDKETKHLALDESESTSEEKSQENKEKSPQVTNIDTTKEKECEPIPETYDKGVIFYMRDNRIVGILLWNVFNRISIARKILSSDDTFNDLNEVAKLFDIFDQHHETK